MGDRFIMADLHLYVNTVGPDTLVAAGVFYSKRAGGPYYRWYFDEKKNRWCHSRLRLDLVPRSLQAPHRAIPVALQKALLGHYLY